MRVRAHPAQLSHDTSRVITRFFLPGDGLPSEYSRVAQIVRRVLSLSESAVEEEARTLLAAVSMAHPDASGILAEHASVVRTRIADSVTLTTAQSVVVGAAFTAQQAVEGAAVCNPSAVRHPDQGGLQPDELRVALSLRCIGEGHVSSVGLAEAVIDAAGTWTFEERARPLVVASVSHGEWSTRHFERALEHEGHLSDQADAVLRHLPERFSAPDLERALLEMPRQLAAGPGGRDPIQAMRDIAASAYRADFDPETPLSARTLVPAASEEAHGMEDARFVRFTDADGVVDYRAVYTAYDRRAIGPRLLTTPDLVHFEVRRLTGSGAKNKCMALFPRPIAGVHLALSRTDGENISLSRSDEGLHWDDVGIVHRPTEPWEMVQVGNCGAPIETSGGWLVLTHGVGALRTYSLGALLLDREDPRRVVARSSVPILRPTADLVDGYVPRVVYSCGAIEHDGTLWLPVGVGDAQVRIFSVLVRDVIETMTRV